MTAPKGFWRRNGWAITVLVVLFAGYAAYEINAYYRLAPRDGFRSFDQITKGLPGIQGVRIAKVGEGEVLVLIATLCNGLMPSGPPLYVFDRSGTLLDWTSETGEGSPLTRFLDEGRLVTLDEARAWIRP